MQNSINSVEEKYLKNKFLSFNSIKSRVIKLNQLEEKSEDIMKNTKVGEN
jgi:hypothetical protein